jgi:diazepam-binding inhibitor (GABA receptor modulating acyl-CoA-binding protein)
MSLDENFKMAVARMDRISKDAPDKDLYKKYGEPLVMLYGYYKVATVGPNTKSKPGILDMKGRKKWEAWTKVTEMGLTQDQAKGYYVQTVLDIIQK